jgi:2-polyprenyl-6-methoxyphenol hydroxylase-like FAD-dependent oxidoreductase
VRQLTQLIRDRVRVALSADTNTMLSSFGVQHYLAASFVKQRVILAGDAAHVVSPIGGQGMNLGWLDAWAVAEALLATLQGQPSALQRFEDKQKRMARTVLGRAAFNMRMGRATRFEAAKYVLAKLLLQKPFAGMLANMFTMRGL